ncbi:MAG TPA: hypothetical protein VHP38_16130 [Ruminiclostridium sp.]|nr:hypothetical protein [Ruminiclostridium sp.]
MKVKIAFLLILSITMTVLSGCWDRVELSDIAIATIAALDKTENNKLQLTFVILIPRQFQQSSSGGSGSGKKRLCADIG